MAFIVEMVWGKPPKVGGAPDPEWREFSCGATFWEQVLELGRRAGWKPLGTIPSKSSHANWSEHGRFDESYEPDSWGYDKQFQGADASSLADALQIALDSNGALPSNTGPSILRDGMTETEFRSANRVISEDTVREFIAFLRKGPFVFAWDD